MSTPEEQAMAVERLTFEVEQAKRHEFIAMERMSQYDGQRILDALAAAQQQIESLQRKVDDDIVNIRAYAPDYLNKRVEQYRKRVHGAAFRIEDALMYLDEGNDEKVRDRLNEAVAALERDIS